MTAIAATEMCPIENIFTMENINMGLGICTVCLNSFGAYELCKEAFESFSQYASMFKDSLLPYLDGLKSYISSGNPSITPEEFSSINALEWDASPNLGPVEVKLEGFLRDYKMAPFDMDELPKKTQLELEAKIQRVFAKWYPEKDMKIESIFIFKGRTDGPGHQLHTDGYTYAQSRLYESSVDCFDAAAIIPSSELPYIPGSKWETSEGKVVVIHNNEEGYLDRAYEWATSLLKTEDQLAKTKKIWVSDFDPKGEAVQRNQVRAIHVTDLTRPAGYSSLRTSIIPGFKLNLGKHHTYSDHQKTIAIPISFSAHKAMNISGCDKPYNVLDRHIVKLPEDRTVFFNPTSQLHQAPRYYKTRVKGDCDSFPQDLDGPEKDHYLDDPENIIDSHDGFADKTSRQRYFIRATACDQAMIGINPKED